MKTLHFLLGLIKNFYDSEGKKERKKERRKERKKQTNKKEEVFGKRGNENSTLFTGVDKNFLRL